jgi:hypothetical protein
MEKLKCIEPGCPFKGGYCRNPFHKKSSGVVEEKKEQPKRKRIPMESPQRKEDNKKYRKVKKELKKEHQTCQIQIKDVCIVEPVFPHHIAGRVGSNLIKKDNLIMACNPCNEHLEKFPLKAMEDGLKKTRLKHSEKREHLYE